MTLDLSQFAGGSGSMYRHSLNPEVIYTVGVKYVGDRAGAYWLIDKIALLQALPEIKKEPFQVWALTVKDSKGLITVNDGGKGTDPVTVYQEVVDYTDFPEPGVTIWFTNNTILLPNEY